MMVRRIDVALAEAGLPALQRYAWVEVDVDVLTANARALAHLATPSALGVVVKADGYGHGLEMAGRCAIAGGASWLCVADVGEAVRLRRDGYPGRVLVLYPVPGAMLATLADLEVDATLGSRADVDEAARLGALRERGRPLRIQIEVDTGMTRGGVRAADAMEVIGAVRASPGLVLTGMWTHLAEPEDRETTAVQIRRFDEIMAASGEAGITPIEVHAAASGGLLAGVIEGHTLVRPGLAFYGVDPAVGAPSPAGVEPALAVRAHPVRLMEVPAGTRVGYAGTWIASRPSRIATLPLGYADGWSRRSSPGSDVLVAGTRAPMVGRVSSDSLTVDVSGVDGVTMDSQFTLLGTDGDEEIDADEVARLRGTISWEVLQQLGARLSRVYTRKGAPVAIRAESSIDLTVTPAAPRF